MMYAYHMPSVLLTDKEAEDLADLAPEFLQGEKKLASQVRWAISRLREYVSAAPTTESKPVSDPARQPA